MKKVLMYLCGYRKYTFKLFTGRIVTFRGRNKGQAIQKALNLERKLRRNREQLLKTLSEVG